MAKRQNPRSARPRTAKGVGPRKRRRAQGSLQGKLAAALAAAKTAKRELRDARRLLSDAIHTLSEGVCLYDDHDRLVLCNERYRQFYPKSAWAMVPGATFEEILRGGLAAGEYPEAIGQEESWLAERLRVHRERPLTEVVQRERHGRWVLIEDRHMAGGGIAGLRIDITELKAAQEAAEAARRRMEDIADASDDWFWETDAGGLVTYLSKPFSADTGVPSKDRIGKLRYDLDPALQANNPAWPPHLERIARRERFHDYVTTITFPVGVRHLSISGKPFFGANGEFAGYRGTTRDITERFENSQRLNRQTEILSSMMENMPTGVALVSADLRFLAFNPPYLDKCGLPADFLQPGDSLEKIVRYYAEQGDYGPGEIDDLMKRHWRPDELRTGVFEQKNLHGRIIEVRRIPLPSGGMVITRIDVTEAREREAALTAAHSRLEEHAQILSRLIDNLPVGISLLDADQRFMTFNGKFLEMFDLTSEQLRPGDTFESFIRYSAERGEYGPGDIEAHIRKRVEGARVPQPRAFSRTRPNGHTIEVRRVALPGGGFVATYIDVTEANQREADLERARALLEQQSDDLRAAAQRLQEVSSAKSLFLANMSHELRTPLNAILGFSEVIRDGLMGQVSDRYREYARDINSSGSHLLHLIDDMLDHAKIEAGRVDLHESYVDLRAVIAECQRLLQDKVREGRVTLKVGIAPDVPLVYCDRVRIKQVLLNLLSNAVKFTPPGGSVGVAAALAGPLGFAIDIADTGIGMHADDIPLALEPFRQIDNQLNRRYEGTGLGLPLAKKLVELHGGEIAIESAPGEGTTVRVYLPAKRLGSAEAVPRRA